MSSKISKLFAFCAICLLYSCGGGGTGSNQDAGGDTITSRAQLLTIIRYDSTYTIAEIADPWNKGQSLGRFILVDRNKKRPDNLPEGTVLEVPLQQTVVYSIVHQQAIKEIGALDGIRAVADSNYITDETICHRMQNGSIVNIGNAHKPDIDKMSKLKPDAVLVSPYDNGMHKVAYELGVPVIECADYMEATPLARAEWILLLGELYGKRDLATMIYNDVASQYTSLKDSVAQILNIENAIRPRVITELVHNGTWYMPGGQSYMAKMLNDAGADYPWADTPESGSLALLAPDVLNRAQSADYWLIRTNQDVTEAMMRENCPLNSRFKAFIDGNVFGCNATVNNIYNDVAFHPEKVLRDFVIIFHPSIIPNQEPKYYKRMTK